MPDEKRLAVVTTHPIQYQVPLWRALAGLPGFSVTVFFGSRAGADRYHDVDFGRDVQWDVPLLDGYDWKVLPNRPLSGINWRLAYRCPSIGRELARGGFDAVLLVGKEFWYYLQAMRAARRLGIPLLLRAETPPPRQGVASAAAADWVRRRLFRQFACILCVGESQRRFYRELRIPEANLGMAPYCVDNAFFRARHRSMQPRRQALRAQYGFSPACRVFAFVGKFTNKKRPQDLIRAFAGLPADGRYGLLMAGSGPLLEACKSLVDRHDLAGVVFAGFRNQTEIVEIYTAADCFVLPSDHGETWGLVVNEAMNFDLPVVVSDRVGCGPDLVREGRNGYRYPFGDVSALTETLARVVEDDDARAEMGRQSGLIVRDYSIEASAEAIRAAVETVTRASRVELAGV